MVCGGLAKATFPQTWSNRGATFSNTMLRGSTHALRFRATRSTDPCRPFLRHVDVARGCIRNVTTGPDSGQDSGISDPVAYCSDLVRRRDYESFLISQFYPNDVRSHFMALRALYVSTHSYEGSDTELHDLCRWSWLQCKRWCPIRRLGK